MKQEYIVTNPGRLDVCIAALFSISRAQAAKQIREGRIFVDGVLATKPSRSVAADAVIECDALKPGIKLKKKKTEEQTPPPDMPVLYEDDSCLVVNKPAGLTVHPGSGTEVTSTLIEILRTHCGNDSLGLVHRLDKETTGCLLVAKDVKSHEALQKQFKDRTIRKTYLAIVFGKPKEKKAVIDAAIGRSLTSRTRMSLFRTGSSREATTTYEVIESTGDISLLRCTIATGRTHQIRVHLAAIGHPILGDSKYGTEKSRACSEEYGVTTLLLHAAELKFLSPATGKEAEVKAEVPGTFSDIGLPAD